MSFTPIAHGLDWQASSFINEFIHAYNERQPNKYGDHDHLLEEVVVGQNIQLASFWKSLQGAVEDEWKSTVVRMDENGYGGQTNGEWVYEGNIPEGTSEEEDLPNNLSDRRWDGFIKACTDFSENGWRRATSWDPAVDDWTAVDGPMWEKPGNGYGQMQVGDIIGPWVFKDLQVAIGNLKYIWFRGLQPPSFLVGQTRELVNVDEDDDLAALWDDAPVEATDVLRTWARKPLLNQPRISSLRRSEGELSIRDGDGAALPAIEVALCGQGTYYFWTSGNRGTILATYDDNGDGITEYPTYTNIRTVAMGGTTDKIGDISQIPTNQGFEVPLSYTMGYVTRYIFGSLDPDFGLLIELECEHE